MKYSYLFLILMLIPHISYTMNTNNESLTVQLKYQANNTAETMHMQITRKKQHTRHKSRMVKLNPHGIAIKEHVIEKQIKGNKKEWKCYKFTRAY